MHFGINTTPPDYPQKALTKLTFIRQALGHIRPGSLLYLSALSEEYRTILGTLQIAGDSSNEVLLLVEAALNALPDIHKEFEACEQKNARPACEQSICDALIRDIDRLIAVLQSSG